VKSLSTTLNGLPDGGGGGGSFMGIGLRRLNPVGLYLLPSLCTTPSLGILYWTSIKTLVKCIICHFIMV
jgi:hypothetical protein